MVTGAWGNFPIFGGSLATGRCPEPLDAELRRGRKLAVTGFGRVLGR